MVGEEPPISLSALSRAKQLAFALLVFERMLPCLSVFSKDTGLDDSYCLQARESAWKALEGKESGSRQSLSEACLKNAPDTEDYSHELTSSALNTALAMRDILEFAMGGPTDLIVDVATLAKDSIYLYLTSLETAVVSSAEQDERIASHPLMRQEMLREAEDIRYLVTLSDRFDNAMITALRARVEGLPPIIPVKGYPDS
jgi:uncharacterized protein